MITTHQKSGFTLIETIIGIAVVALVVTAATSLTTTSLTIGRTSINQFAAFHQAEEGLEITRNIRDSNWLQNKSWRAGLANGTYAIAFASQCPDNGPWCLVPTVSGMPGRSITISTSTDGDGVLHVTSAVDYQERDVLRNVSLSTELTDWKKGPL